MGPHYARSQSAPGLATPQPPRLWASSEPARRSGAGGALSLLTRCGAGCLYPYKKFRKARGESQPALAARPDCAAQLPCEDFGRAASSLWRLTIELSGRAGNRHAAPGKHHIGGLAGAARGTRTARSNERLDDAVRGLTPRSERVRWARTTRGPNPRPVSRSKVPTAVQAGAERRH